MAATAPGVANGSYQQYLAEAIKRFSRSVELCDDYLRGYYGLKLVSSMLPRTRVRQLTFPRSQKGCSPMATSRRNKATATNSRYPIQTPLSG